MVEFGSGSVLGASIETSELTNNSVTYAKLGDVIKGELLETISFSGDTTKTSGTLTAYNNYYMVANFTETGGNNILIRFNGDTGANYRYVYLNNVTPTTAVSQSSIIWGNTGGTRCLFEAKFSGVTRATAGGFLTGNFKGGLAGYAVGITGGWAGGNATQVSTITVFSTGTITGTLKIYGVE